MACGMVTLSSEKHHLLPLGIVDGCHCAQALLLVLVDRRGGSEQVYLGDVSVRKRRVDDIEADKMQGICID